MSSDGNIVRMIQREINYWWNARNRERHAIVSAYDPVKHLVKATLQPGGQETGWLTDETSHIGNGYGLVFGLQPGAAGAQPGTQSGNQGDQVIVRLQEGDIESGKVSGRVHSDVDTPPVVQSGEAMLYTKFHNSGAPSPDGAAGGQGGTGQQLYLKNDGSFNMTDGNGATTVFDGAGNVTETST